MKWILGFLLLFSSMAGARPNFVFIVADDLGYGDLGVHGCKDIPTPHIDSIAAAGIRFSDGYSNHPFCSPMRAGSSKLLRNREVEGAFDLASDASEAKRLPAARAAGLRVLWETWNAQNIDPGFPGFGPYHEKRRAFFRQLHEASEAPPR